MIDSSPPAVSLTQEAAQIVVSNLHKRWGDNHVLRGVDLEVLRGKRNIIIGGSGAGKTVLMRHLVVLERPDEGSIRLDGVEKRR